MVMDDYFQCPMHLRQKMKFGRKESHIGDIVVPWYHGSSSSSSSSSTIVR